MAVCQSLHQSLIHRYRAQAPSHLLRCVISGQASAVSAGETILVLPPRDLPELKYSAIDS